jgi:hypothetical protein
MAAIWGSVVCRYYWQENNIRMEKSIKKVLIAGDGEAIKYLISSQFKATYK